LLSARKLFAQIGAAALIRAKILSVNEKIIVPRTPKREWGFLFGRPLSDLVFSAGRSLAVI
jgi:hypothetical protein